MGEGSRDDAARARRHNLSVGAAGGRAGGRAGEERLSSAPHRSRAFMQGPRSWAGWQSSWVVFPLTGGVSARGVRGRGPGRDEGWVGLVCRGPRAGA